MTRHERDRDTLPFLQLLPSLITILGLCAGLTSISFVFSERYEPAAVLIVLAALTDGLDGLLARKLEATSSFGAELDTLSDFVSFGVAPGLLVFQFALADARGLGWIAALVYVICCCLRLARFNVNRDVPIPGSRPHFVGVPAPAGAFLAMLPVFLSLAGVIDVTEVFLAVELYLGLVGALMISKLPTFSPKSLRIPKDKAVWLLVAAAILVGVLFMRFWLLMIALDVLYMLSLVHAFATRRTAVRNLRFPDG